MRFEVTFEKSGEAIGFKILADPEEGEIGDEELRRRLDSPDVGLQLWPSVLALRGIVGRLLARADLPDDVKHTLVLIDQASQYAMITKLVESEKDIVDSEYRRQLLSIQRILAGDVPSGKGGIHVTGGVFQNVVLRAIEGRHTRFVTATPEQRAILVEETSRDIFLLVGRAPGAGIVEEALDAAGRKGRPRGTRNGFSLTRSKNEIYNDLLRAIGLQSTSAEGLKKQRKRKRKRGAT